MACISKEIPFSTSVAWFFGPWVLWNIFNDPVSINFASIFLNILSFKLKNFCGNEIEVGGRSY